MAFTPGNVKSELTKLALRDTLNLTAIMVGYRIKGKSRPDVPLQGHPPGRLSLRI